MFQAALKVTSNPSLVAEALVPKTQLYYFVILFKLASCFFCLFARNVHRFAAFFLFQTKLLFCSFLLKLFSMLSFSKNHWVCQMIYLSLTLLITLFFVFTVSLSLSPCLSFSSLSLNCVSLNLLSFLLYSFLSLSISRLFYWTKSVFYFSTLLVCSLSIIFLFGGVLILRPLKVSELDLELPNNVLTLQRDPRMVER